MFAVENPYLIRYSREMIVNLLKVDIEFNLSLCSLFEYIFVPGVCDARAQMRFKDFGWIIFKMNSTMYNVPHKE